MDRKFNIACHSNQFVHKSNAVGETKSLSAAYSSSLDASARCLAFLSFFCSPILYFAFNSKHLSFHLAEYCRFNSHKYIHMRYKMQRTLFIRVLFAYIKPPIGVKEKYIENHGKLSSFLDLTPFTLLI